MDKPVAQYLGLDFLLFWTTISWWRCPTLEQNDVFLRHVITYHWAQECMSTATRVHPYFYCYPNEIAKTWSYTPWLFPQSYRSVAYRNQNAHSVCGWLWETVVFNRCVKRKSTLKIDISVISRPNINVKKTKFAQNQALSSQTSFNFLTLFV